VIKSPPWKTISPEIPLNLSKILTAEMLLSEL